MFYEATKILLFKCCPQFLPFSVMLRPGPGLFKNITLFNGMLRQAFEPLGESKRDLLLLVGAPRTLTSWETLLHFV